MAEIGAPKARAREGASAGGAAAPEVASQNNPLLGIGFDIPFDALLPAHVEPAVAELLERSRRNIEAIENDPSPACVRPRSARWKAWECALARPGRVRPERR